MLRTEEPFCKQQRVENEFEGKHCLMALNLALFADLGFLNEEEKRVKIWHLPYRLDCALKAWSKSTAIPKTILRLNIHAYVFTRI